MENINLHEVIDAGVYHVLCPTTHKRYTVYLKKFVIFVKADDYLIGDMIPSLACFFYDLGRVCEYKPHVKKSCLAAINFGIQYHHLEKIHAFKHIYPDLHLILQQKSTESTKTPHI